MHHVMFDIDGTLVESFGFDIDCFDRAVKTVTGISMNQDPASYKHVTDTGILDEIITANGLVQQRVEIQHQVKQKFVTYVAEYLDKTPVKPVPGADLFVQQLHDMANVFVSFATGGWHETAMLKLKSAGIRCTGVVIASSNDDYRRTEIMRLAMAQLDEQQTTSITYFGDGIWDKLACAELGFNFVLVGNRTEHSQTINNYLCPDKALAYIGL